MFAMYGQGRPDQPVLWLLTGAPEMDLLGSGETYSACWLGRRDWITARRSIL